MTCMAVQSAFNYDDRTDHHTIAEWERTERRFEYKRCAGELYNYIPFRIYQGQYDERNYQKV